MLRRIFREALVICGITLFFMLICATVGITTNTPSTQTAKADYDRNYSIEDEENDCNPCQNIEGEPTPVPK